MVAMHRQSGTLAPDGDYPTLKSPGNPEPPTFLCLQVDQHPSFICDGEPKPPTMMR